MSGVMKGFIHPRNGLTESWKRWSGERKKEEQIKNEKVRVGKENDKKDGTKCDTIIFAP